MQALKARVVNGRYVIDEPAQLPEGAEVDSSSSLATS
jgi:hypothetical protein